MHIQHVHVIPHKENTERYQKGMTRIDFVLFNASSYGVSIVCSSQNWLLTTEGRALHYVWCCNWKPHHAINPQLYQDWDHVTTYIRQLNKMHLKMLFVKWRLFVSASMCHSSTGSIILGTVSAGHSLYQYSATETQQITNMITEFEASC